MTWQMIAFLGALTALSIGLLVYAEQQRAAVEYWKAQALWWMQQAFYSDADREAIERRLQFRAVR